MTKYSHLRRSELFLVRMWTENSDGSGPHACGKVQRAVSGETSQFDDLQGLLDRLRAMVANDKQGKALDDTHTS